MRGHTFVPGSCLMAMNAARAGCRQQKPGTGVDVVSRRVGAVGIEFGEPALRARQALLGSRQQPLDRLRPVAFDGIPVVVQAAVIENAEIELRGGLAAFGSKPEVPHRAGFQRTLLADRRNPVAAKPARKGAFRLLRKAASSPRNSIDLGNPLRSTAAPMRRFWSS